MIRQALIGMIRGYQILVSPLKPSCCRFFPSCSQYAIESIRKQGVWIGIYHSARRVLKCHPFHPGGYDPA